MDVKQHFNQQVRSNLRFKNDRKDPEEGGRVGGGGELRRRENKLLVTSINDSHIILILVVTFISFDPNTITQNPSANGSTQEHLQSNTVDVCQSDVRDVLHVVCTKPVFHSVSF